MRLTMQAMQKQGALPEAKSLNDYLESKLYLADF
jgi:hypothetical protein